MIYFNFAPISCLIGGAASLYLSFKSAKLAFPKIYKPIFGTNPVKDRIDQAVKKTLEGKLSILKFVFGENSLSDRSFSLITGIFYSGCSIAFIFLAYSLYYKSKELQPHDIQTLEQCHQRLESFRENLEEGNQLYQFWTQNLCKYHQDQWDYYIYFAKSCFNTNFMNHHEMKPLCNDFFTKQTYESLARDVLPRQQVEDLYPVLIKGQSEVNEVCDKYLFEAGQQVNEECNSLHPYIGFSAEKVCNIVKFASFFGISEECNNACGVFEEQFKEIKSKVRQQIPKTQDFILNCTETLPEKTQNSGFKLENADPEKVLPQAVKDHIEEQLILFGQEDWRNLTYLSQFDTPQERDPFNKETDIWGQVKPDPHPEKDPESIKVLNNFFAIRRKVIADLKSKVDLDDQLSEYKRILPRERIGQINKNKYNIVK